MLLVMGGIAVFGNMATMKSFPLKQVGNGQHGTARFATKAEVEKTYKHIPYTPKLWREGDSLPTADGLIVGCQESESL